MEDVSKFLKISLTHQHELPTHSRGQTPFGVSGPTFVHLGLLSRFVLDLELITESVQSALSLRSRKVGEFMSRCELNLHFLWCGGRRARKLGK